MATPSRVIHGPHGLTTRDKWDPEFQSQILQDKVKIETYVLTGFGWSKEAAWVPRKVALSKSQDAFLLWVHSEEGETWRKTWSSEVQAVFVSDFSFNEKENGEGTVFVEKGTRVKLVCNPPPDEPAVFCGYVGDRGVMQECGRIGDDAGWNVYDVLLDNGNEITAYGFQLERDE